MSSVLISKLKLYYQNIRGMRTKSKEFFVNLIANSYDIIFLCETWLTDGFYDSEFFDNRYVVFRVDRRVDLTGLTRGGGCLIAVKSSLSAMRRPEWELDKEDVWISVVHECGSKTNFNVRYVEDGNKLAGYDVHFKRICDIVTSTGSSDRFVFLGDFNLSDAIDWYTGDGVYDPG